jgi:hypothetical protein
MGSALVIIFALVFFWVMSWSMRITVALVLAASVFIGLSANTDAGGEGTVKLLSGLVSLNAGLIVLGSILGCMRIGVDDERYRARRLAFFKFTGKWLGLYAIFYVVMTFILSKFFEDDGAIWIGMRFFGIYAFAGVVLIIYLIKQASAKRKARAPE